MIADYQGPDKLAVLKFSIAIVYLIWDAICVTYTYQVSPGSYARERRGIMPQQFDESLNHDPTTPPPVGGEYDGAVITPLLAPVVTGPSTNQGEMKQHPRAKLLSTHQAVVGK